MASTNKAVSSLLKLWDKTEARTGGLIPDGTYEVVIADAESCIKNDKLKAHYVMKVRGGKFDGKNHHKWDNLMTEMNLEYFKGDLKNLNIDIPESVDEVEELNEMMKGCIGKVVEVRVKTNGDFTNTYIQQLLEESDEATEGDGDLEKGDKVTFEDADGDDVTGTIKKIKGDKATVIDEDGDKHTVEVDELALVD